MHSHIHRLISFLGVRIPGRSQAMPGANVPPGAPPHSSHSSFTQRLIKQGNPPVITQPPARRESLTTFDDACWRTRFSTAWVRIGTVMLAGALLVLASSLAQAQAPLSGASKIAAGTNHTCALTSGGAVQCWGRNIEGQLGDNTTTQRLVPTAVSGLTSGVTAIAAGRDHTCALTSGGRSEERRVGKEC